MNRVAIRSFGMVTGAGLDGLSTCSAIRAAVDNFGQTRFLDRAGRAIAASQVAWDGVGRGLGKLSEMAARAIRECLSRAVPAPPPSREIVLLLCVAESNRPGRVAGLDDRLLVDIQSELGVTFHESSRTMACGRVGGVVALAESRRDLSAPGVSAAIIAGVDSLLTAETLDAFERRERLLTSGNSNGFVPGEAAAAVLATRDAAVATSTLYCDGMGESRELARVDEELPLRGDGLASAIAAALSDARRDFGDVGGIFSDANGEQYHFREAALAQCRLLRKRVARLEIWQPADCLGEIGAAIAPCVMGFAHHLSSTRSSPGDCLLGHFSADDGRRAALVMTRPKGVDSRV